MRLYLQAVVSGVMAGGLYAVMALGVSLTWGLLKVINLAHLALVLVGAYSTYQLATSAAVDPLVTVVLTVPAFFLVGAAVQWLFDRFRVSEFNSLLVSFGLLLIVVQVVTNVWSADFRRMDAALNPYATRSVFVGAVALQVPLLIAFSASLVIALATAWTLRRTYVGKALRALAHDRSVASAFGIDHARLSMLLSGFSAATGALAGTLVGISSGLFPGLAVEWFGIVFTVVILGGIGNLPGTVAAAFVVGATSGLTSVLWGPPSAPLATFTLLILALLFRPEGLFTRRRAA